MKARLAILIGTVLMLLIASAALAGHEPGVRLFDEQNFEQASRYFEDALEQNPEDPLVHYYLGRIAYEAPDYDGAVDHFKAAVKLEKTNSDYHLWLGRAYLEKLQTASFFAKGNLAGKVRGSYEKAVKLNPESVEARLALGNYYLNAPAIGGGSKKKAKTQAVEIMARDPEMGHLFMGAIYEYEEEYEEAAREYEAYLDETPEAPEALYDIAILYQKMERFEDATAVLDRAVKLDPGFSEAWYQLGRTAALSGEDLDHGIAAMRHYIDHFGEIEGTYQPGSRWRLGMLFEHKGDPKKARRYYEEALRIDPDFEQAQESLDRLTRETRTISERK